MLALRAAGRCESPLSPAHAARFPSDPGDYLDKAPIALVRTASGAEQARRVLEWEPALPPPDPVRIAGADALDDLTAEEAYVAYADGRIASPRLMAATGLRSFHDVMGALTQRGLRLPRRPSPVGPGRDDRDLLWEALGGREDPALVDPVPRYLRPAPPPGPELDALWPSVAPDDAASRDALAAVAVALDAQAGEAEAARAAAAAAGLRGDAEAVGGETARARLVAWVAKVVGTREGEHPAWRAALVLLQPLRAEPPSFELLAGGDGALELARTAEGAALVDRWLEPRPGPDPARVVAATDLDDLSADEAYAAYADGRIDSRRLMAIVAEESFFQVWGRLALRGLSLPEVPTYVGPGRDDRDLLWEACAGPEEEGPAGGP